MHFYVTGYKFGMMLLVSLSFSRCVNFVGRGQVFFLVLVLKGLVLITTLGVGSPAVKGGRGKEMRVGRGGKGKVRDTPVFQKVAAIV